MANQVANKVSIAAYLTNDAVKNQINKVVGGKNGDRFISSLMSAVQTNQTLQKCTNNSLVNAALLGYTLNLSPSPQLGYFYMVPYNNHGTMEAQFQIGYRGLLQLAMRSGQYRKINAVPIKEGEFVSYNPLDESIEVNIIQDPEAREKAPTIGYYAMFEYLNGFRKEMYWSRGQMEAHARRYSKSYGSGPWKTDFDKMAIKTMLRQLLGHYGIMSIDMEAGFLGDQAVIDYRDGQLTPRYVDSTPEGAIASAQEEISESANTQEIDVAPEAPQKAAGPAEQNTQRTKSATQSNHQEQAEAIPQPDF
ncbi:recombinase RecT [Porcincola intestinalis]|uniref:Recombinase n=1 Tax=Porcincola intestinalis TaxID=2606632 RepID=A0A6L5X097_9FIRM|nr:recombinase RecT [Porcincola intestinalis]MSS13680.1 recombinase [Porcincola intestinalis]